MSVESGLAPERASIRRHRAIFESALDFAIMATDRDGLITDWNAGAQAIFGWTADEMIGEPVDRCFTPEDRAQDRAAQNRCRALQEGRRTDERWHLTRSGHRFWGTGEMVPLRDEAGGHLGFLTIVRDETRRREALDKLRLSEEFLQSILASSEDCIQVLDLDARLVFMSEGGRRSMEVADFEAIRGRRWPVTCPEDLRGSAREAVEAAKAGGTGHYQGPTETFAGTPKWWDVRVTPILDAEGRPEKLLAISRDITAARMAERALREAEGLNALILNSSGDCAVVLDLDASTQYVSPGGLEALEITDVDAIIGLSWLRVWDGADNRAAREALEAARAGRTGQFQGFCPTHKGTPKWWDVVISPIPGADGKPERLVAVGRDITLFKQADQRLARSEERLSFALGAAGMVGVWDWDLKTDVVYADGNVARLYSVDPAWAAGGAPLAEYVRTIHPDDRPGFQAELDRVLAGKAEFEDEYRLRQPDGTVRWVLARGRLIRDADGTPVRFPGASLDITERKEAEARGLAVLELGDRLRDLSEPAAMAYAAAEIMGRALQVQRAGYGTVNLASDEVVIERDWTLPGIASIAGTHAFRDFGSYIDDLKQGLSVVIDDVRADPRTRANAAAWEGLGVRSIVNIPVMEHGRFVAVFYLHQDEPRVWGDEPMAFARNVADRTRSAVERRHVEEQLRALNADLERRVEERTRDLDRMWHNAQDLLVVVDRQGVFHAVSPAAEKILGWTPEEMIGLSVFDFIHLEDRPRSGGSLDKTKGEALPVVLNRYRSKDGGYRWLSWVAAPEDDLIYAYGRDITAEKEQAEALRSAEDQLRQAQKMEAVGQLTGGVAHDFNNLLTVIRSSVDLLKRPNLTEERRLRYIEAISDTTTRASRLTGQLLAFARRQALKPEVFDVGRGVAAMIDMVVTLTGSRIRITTAVPDKPCFANADPNQFETALVNMAVNARDAMNGEGQLTIAVAHAAQIPPLRSDPGVAGDFVTVSITDTGIGIPSGDIDRIFEPFFTTKAVGQGTGLGLSQVFGFAKQSGGEVSVQSEGGHGTTFTLYLPLVVAQTARLDPIDDRPEPPVDGNGTCVLVVEDNADVGSFATQSLQELGYDTVLAADAAEALALLDAHRDRFDVVFSDVVMPGMDGIELGQAIRRRHAGLPVVLTSGYSHVLAQNGTSGFELLNKPYSIEALSHVLRKAAAGRQRLAASL